MRLTLFSISLARIEYFFLFGSVVSFVIHVTTFVWACPIVEVVIGVGGSVYQVVAKMFYVVQIHDYPCCMESAIVLLKYLRLSEILCIHGIPVTVIAAVIVRLRRWNTPIYRSWAGVVMCGLPLLERSWADPVWFNLCQRRANVLLWTMNCRTNSDWYCPA